MALTGLVAANNLSDVVDRERAWDNLGSSLATGDIAIPAPSLDLNFAANKSLVDDISGNNLITFSRASTGTFVGSNGLIQTAASGVPRFDHNPVTGESLGLLVEEAKTNLATRSEDFSDVIWTKNNITVTPNVAIAPDGTITADKVTVNTGATSWYMLQTLGSSPSASSCSVYAKAAGWDFVSVGRGFVFGAGDYAIFNLQTGTVSRAPTFTNSTASITHVGNGWYRCILVSPQTDNNFHVTPQGVGTSINGGVPNGVNGIFTWGAQIETGSFPTSYIPTVASTVTRAADVASITGANFSGWYNQGQGSLLHTGRFIGDVATNTYARGNGLIAKFDNSGLSAFTNQWTIGGERSAGPNLSPYLQSVIYNGTTPQILNSDPLLFNVPIGNQMKVSAYIDNANGSYGHCLNGGNVSERLIVNTPTWNRFSLSTAYDGSSRCGTIARFQYWRTRLNAKTLQYITQSSASTTNFYSFSFAVKGRDVLALEGVSNTSTRDFAFVKGLVSAAQPRLTAAAASTASGLALASNGLLKLAPVSSGNYFFASGLTLSGVTTRINGTNALSIATSPFSGSTATAPLLFRELRPQANWRITEPMPSGTIATPDLAIPFETNDFVLFMKAGQN